MPTYRYKELRTVAAHFRGDKRFGRTTKLVHGPSGAVLIEVMGAVTKLDAHRAYQREMTKLENLDGSVR